jgi:hypothetical protein
LHNLWTALIAFILLVVAAYRRQSAMGTSPLQFTLPAGPSRPGRGRPRFSGRQLALVLVLLTALAWAGCGGGGSSVTHSPGTPAGTYTLTVTGTSGSLSNTVTLTLVVN